MAFNRRKGCDEAFLAFWLIHYTDKVVGRLATQVAALLQGKHKVLKPAEEDRGDYVVIYNVKQVCTYAHPCVLKGSGAFYWR